MTNKTNKIFTGITNAQKINKVVLGLAYDEDYSARGFTNGDILKDILKNADVKPHEYETYARELIRAKILDLKSFGEIKTGSEEINVNIPDGAIKNTKIAKSGYGVWLDFIREAAWNDDLGDQEAPGHYEAVSGNWLNSLKYESLMEKFDKENLEFFIAKALYDHALRPSEREGDFEGYIIEDHVIWYMLHYCELFTDEV